jgi:hypothetical protein
MNLAVEAPAMSAKAWCELVINLFSDDHRGFQSKQDRLQSHGAELSYGAG